MAKQDFSKVDFSKMLFNIFEIKQGTDLCYQFSQLSMYPEFQQYSQKDRNYVIRFVLYAYDKNSPLLEYKDLKVRHQHCLDLAGVTSKTRREEILEGGDKAVNAMIKCFLTKIQNNRKFNLYVSLESAFRALIENISEPITKGEKTDQKKLQEAYKIRFDNSKNAQETIKMLESLEKDIWPEFDEVRGIIMDDKEQSIFSAGAAESLADMRKQSENGKA